MQRCVQLAKLGAGLVAPNPMVGAVLVYNDEIIGEGYHQQYGKPHAEVNCINSVKEADKEKIPLATLYVSLEPCNHFGKTPPCSHLIVSKNIKRVVIGCRDNFELVNGKGIQYLQQHNVEIIENILQEECTTLNKRFFVFHAKKQPYIILKYAQTQNGFIGNFDNERLIISNHLTQLKNHQWRGEEAAILIAKKTALKDNPTLTNRNITHKNPIRLLLDKYLQVPLHFNIYNNEAATIVFNLLKNEQKDNITFVKIDEKKILQQILHYCYNQKIISLIVEGGAQLLQSFIDENLWNEARMITNTELMINNGIKAPTFIGKLIKQENILNNTIQYFIPTNE